jgi:hypothetical protein
MTQVALTLAKQLTYLSAPGIKLGKLITAIALITHDYTKRVTSTREAHEKSMEQARLDNQNNDTKLEDEFEFLVDAMRKDATVESLQENLPRALEALENIKAEYRRCASDRAYHTIYVYTVDRPIHHLSVYC